MRFKEIMEGLKPGEHAPVDVSAATNMQQGLTMMRVKLDQLEHKVKKYGKLADPKDVEAVRQLKDVIKQFEGDKLGGLGDVFKKIEAECSDFLQVAKQEGTFLYRGLKDVHKPAFTIFPRANRAPLATNPQLSYAVDQIFASVGAEANRSNSLFVSSDRSQAQQYGSVYYIFPKNGFKYTWTNSRDLFYDIGRGVTKWDDEQWNRDALKKYMNPQFQAELRTWVGKDVAHFEDTCIPAFVKRPLSELPGWAGGSLATDLWYLYYDKRGILKSTGKKLPSDWLLNSWYMQGTPQECAAELGVKVNTGLHDAMQKGLEVMILGECYALSYIDYRKFVGDFFLGND